MGKITGLVFSWALALAVLELGLASSPLAALGTSLSGIVIVCAAAIAAGLDFFGAAVLAAYSSVFVLLTLVAIHLGRSWVFFAPARTHLMWGVWSVAAISAYAGYRPLPLSPISAWDDHVAAVSLEAFSPVELVHLFFVRMATFESTLLNLYLLQGLISGVAALGGIYGNPFPAKVSAGPTPRGAAAPLRSRRSWRRRSSGATT